MFREDLLAVLQRWQEKGDRVVLIIDVNEDVIDGAMFKQLASDDLQMREIVHSETKDQGQNHGSEKKIKLKASECHRS